MSDWAITDIILRTEPRGEHGQNILVLVQLDDGRQVELIRSFGALPDINIDHYVTHHGISEAIARAS
jgi:hypothetical protein